MIDPVSCSRPRGRAPLRPRREDGEGCELVGHKAHWRVVLGRESITLVGQMLPPHFFPAFDPANPVPAALQRTETLGGAADWDSRWYTPSGA